MVFNTSLSDAFYDTEAIGNFYDSISTKVDGISITWRGMLKKVDDPMEANSASIRWKGKTIFTMHNTKNQAVINIENIKGIETEYYSSLIEAGLLFVNEAVSYKMPLVLAGVHTLMLFFIFLFVPELIFIALPSLILLFISEFILAKKLLNFGPRILVSGLFLVSCALLLPASILHIPLMLAISKNYTRRHALEHYIASQEETNKA